jgi:hypothetical protein
MDKLTHEVKKILEDADPSITVEECIPAPPTKDSESGAAPRQDLPE